MNKAVAKFSSEYTAYEEQATVADGQTIMYP